MEMKEFLLSPFGMATAILLRTLLATLCITGGIHLFDCKNMTNFFTKKRLCSLFLLIIGLRFMWSAL